jgi:LemA protein
MSGKGREHIMSTTGWIVLGVVAVVVLWIISVYNGLVSMGQRVGQAFADIDVQLRQRHDLIPNLVETVKGYAAHERGTLDDVIKARNAAISAQGPQAQAAAETQLTGMLGRLIALSEAYPDLKANANFQQLQLQLTDIENKLAAARRFFNNAVSEYNARIAQFPAALFAGMFGFSARQFFDLGDDRRAVQEAPQVKF